MTTKPRTVARFPPKHIVAAVDVDPAADRSIADRLVDDACILASSFGAKLTLVHVAIPVSSTRVSSRDALEAYQGMSDVIGARAAASARALQELEKQARDCDVQASSRLITARGSVPELILEVVEASEADMVVLGTHGRRGLARLLLGSVSERTAHMARVPVLLLPPR